jgi:radical SAM protein with 4Fe4S-binding SPASM domain
MIECERFGDGFMSQLNLWAYENDVPLTLTMELTPFCNFSCVMCYVRLNKDGADSQGQFLSLEDWISIAEQAKEMGTLNLTLTGGEPFLYPQFWALYEKLNRMGFIINIMSNGSLIDETVMSNFEKYGMPYFVKITLYGADNETYQKVCGSSDGFTRVAKAIDLLKASYVPVMLSSTIVHENAHDLKAMYDFAKQKDVPIKHTVSVVKSSRGSINSISGSRFEFADFPDELSLEYLEKSKIPWNKDPFALCLSKRRSLFVTWHGHLQLCSFLSDPYVGYSGLLETDYKLLSRKLNSIKNPDECETCEWQEFCQRCPAILCSESGHPEKTDKAFCNMAKRLYEIYKIKKGI